MGTRATIRIEDQPRSRGGQRDAVCAYRRLDGYPAIAGAEILAVLEQYCRDGFPSRLMFGLRLDMVSGGKCVAECDDDRLGLDHYYEVVLTQPVRIYHVSRAETHCDYGPTMRELAREYSVAEFRALVNADRARINAAHGCEVYPRLEAQG